MRKLGFINLLSAVHFAPLSIQTCQTSIKIFNTKHFVKQKLNRAFFEAIIVLEIFRRILLLFRRKKISNFLSQVRKLKFREKVFGLKRTKVFFGEIIDLNLSLASRWLQSQAHRKYGQRISLA